MDGTYTDLQPVIGLNVDCDKCPKLVVSRKLYPHGKPTWGYGNEKSPFIFIGEAPGKNGCGRTGIPFNGDRSGDLFQECLQVIGMTLNDVYTTNIVKCCPENNRTPTPEEMDACSDWLKAEFTHLTGRLVIPLGAAALYYFAPNRRISEAVGSVIISKPHIIIPFFHPAYALRTGASESYKQGFKTLLAVAETAKHLTW